MDGGGTLDLKNAGPLVFRICFDFRFSDEREENKSRGEFDPEGAALVGLGEEADAGKKMPKRKAFAPRAWPSGPTHAGPIRPLSLSAAEYVLIFRSA